MECMEFDCQCGYATHNTDSCRQVECRKYVNREATCAQIESEAAMKREHDKYLQRILNALNKI